VQTVGITGASGYVGSRVVSAIEAAGMKAVRLLRKPKPGSSDRCYALDADLSDDLFVDLDVLIHCAWDMRISEWDEVQAVNVAGSARLFEAAFEANVSRVIFLSSMSAYSGCQSNYGKSKLAVEERLRQSNKALVIRPGLIYGDEPGGIVGTLCQMADKSPILPMIGLGNFLLYTCHEDDLAGLITHFCLIPSGTERLPTEPVIAAETTGRCFKDIVRFLAGRSLVFIPVPWRLAWIGLRALEALGVRARLKSDSLIGLVKADPAPNFDAHGILPVSFRPLRKSA